MTQSPRMYGRSKPQSPRPRVLVSMTVAQNIGLGLFVVVSLAVITKGYLH